MEYRTKYLNVFNLLLKLRGKLKIAIIGANDGKINDPLFDTLIANQHRTKVLCIEPNPYLIPYLKKNYATHPQFFHATCAIGEEKDLILYAIKPEYFSLFQPDYAQSRNWPLYRAATGLTSGNREHVVNSLLRENIDPDLAIEELKVKCHNLTTVLENLQFDEHIDVLQIDTEGFDDNVIYFSSINKTCPSIIYFEHAHIPQTRIIQLNNHLYNHKYRIITCGSDTLALKKRPRILNLLTRLYA